MKPRERIPLPLRELADLQAGVLSRAQVTAHLGDSVVKRLLREGSWHRLASGVYCQTSGPARFETLAWAGVLAAGEGSMLGEHAAGHVLGLCQDPPSEVVILAPQTAHVALGPPWRLVRRRQLPTPRGLLPVPPPEWTVLDLCDCDPQRAVQWVTAALRQRLVTPQRLHDALDQRARISRTPIATRKLLREMLRDAQGLESPLEHLYATRVERAHGLPRGRRQVRAGGRRRDVCYDGLVVELDGRLGHAETQSVFRDMARDNAASLQGLFTHRYGYDDCSTKACETAFQVAAKLRQLGWREMPRACPDCRSSDLWLPFGLR